MKQKWQEKERKGASKMGARQTPRSGGLWFAKGDYKDDNFLYDAKDTGNSRFAVTSKIWKKLRKEALLSGRMPALAIEFCDDSDKEKKIKLVVLDEDDFLLLKEKWEQKEK